MEKKPFTFEEIVEQNERRIHYHLHKLNIRDPHKEFYQEGLIAMWSAYKNYQPDKGPLATYFNYIIRNRLIDLIRKDSRRLAREELASSEEEAVFETEIYHKGSSPEAAESAYDEALWQRVSSLLTEKQWKWVRYYILEERSQKEIAEIEGVSVEAVKGWAKEAKRKLRKVGAEEIFEN